jgi:hypothetical protein
MFSKFIKVIMFKLKNILKFFIFIMKYKFISPPSFSDISGYETLLML